MTFLALVMIQSVTVIPSTAGKLDLQPLLGVAVEGICCLVFRHNSRSPAPQDRIGGQGASFAAERGMTVDGETTDSQNLED